MPASDWRSVFDSSLTWVEREIHRFLFGPDADPMRWMGRIKPLVELALACDLGLSALSAADEGWARRQVARLQRLRDVVVADAGEGSRLAVLVPEDPKPGGALLSLLASFSQILDRWGALSGWRDPKPWIATAHPEWIATLDLLALGDSLGFGAATGSLAGADAILPANTAYVLSHVVLFRTDFGRKRAGISAAERAWLHIRAPHWLRQHIADVDLLCVLVLMMRCAQAHDDAVDVAAAIVGRQEADGAVVGNHEVEIPAQAGADSSCSWFRRRYHATLVANMAAAMSHAANDTPR